jgi:catechol 2,3-dioxygenase-like lactoylglutathione lyase family enzyme
LVLRARDIEVAKHFYELLGLQFISEKHGSGPQHFAATLPGDTVFEIYPCTGARPAGGLRLGLRVQDPDAAILRVVAAGLTTRPRPGSEAGQRVVDDPDGNTVELAALADG